MKNIQYSFWGNFIDFKKEKKYIAYTLSEIQDRNRIGIAIGTLAFLLVGITDFTRIGFCTNSYITFGIRLLFFAFACYIFFSWKKRKTLTDIYAKSFIFSLLIGNIITIIIYFLNKDDNNIDIIDLLTVPLSFILVYVFIIIPTQFLLISGIITSIIYLFIISKFDNIDDSTVFILGIILLTMNVMGLYITRFFNLVRRNEFIRIREIKKLNAGLHEEIEERIAIQDKLSQAYFEITESMKYANHLQVSMLPDLSIINKYTSDFFMMYKPCEIVSGDFYWLSAQENNLIIAVADCTGHGIRAAFMSIVGITLLEDIVNDKGIVHANEILNQLREHIIKTLKQTGAQQTSHDGLDIALCVINTKEMTLEYAGAYNPLLHIRNQELVEYKADRMPISYYIAAKPSFTNNVIKFQPGDLFYIFSDGYSDQFGGEKNKKYTYKRLKRELLLHANLSLKNQHEVLQNAHNEWKGNYSQTDDIVLLGFKI